MSTSDSRRSSRSLLESSLSQLRKFHRDAACGHFEYLEQQTLRHPELVNSADPEDGTTALIHAACFGHVDTVSWLLDKGASVDACDHAGWTALMWAINHQQQETATVLLQWGAQQETRSKRGRTARDFVHLGMSTQFRESWQSILEEQRRDALVPDQDENVFEEPEEEDQIDFFWDEPRLDQMIVYDDRKRTQLLAKLMTQWRPVDFVVYAASLSGKGRMASTSLPVPANVLFLCARYAHYLGTRESLGLLLSEALQRMNGLVKDRAKDVHIQSFWLSNILQLLYYLKKDPGLIQETSDFQVILMELAQETYVRLVEDARLKLDHVLEPSILHYEPIPGAEHNEYAEEEDDEDLPSVDLSQKTVTEMATMAMSGDFQQAKALFAAKAQSLWSWGFNNAPSNTSAPNQKQNVKKPTLPPASTVKSMTPRSITTVLSATLLILQTHNVPKPIVFQWLHQTFYYLGHSLFNQIMRRRRFLCRWKAMQIRMNVCQLEEFATSLSDPQQDKTSLAAWLHTGTMEQSPATEAGLAATSASLSDTQSLVQYLRPVVHLTQLLQVCSSFLSPKEVDEAMSTLGALSMSDVAFALQRYRHEVNETPLSPDVLQYVQKKAEADALLKGEEVPLQRQSIAPTMIGQRDALKMLPFSLPTAEMHYQHLASMFVPLDLLKQI